MSLTTSANKVKQNGRQASIMRCSLGDSLCKIWKLSLALLFIIITAEGVHSVLAFRGTQWNYEEKPAFTVIV